MMASVYACACKTKYIQMAMMKIVYELQDSKGSSEVQEVDQRKDHVMVSVTSHLRS
jgi:hypothetical protein